MNLPLDERPVIAVLAGSNGAGKSTFYHAHLRRAGLRLVNADVLAQELGLDPYAAARAAGAVRDELVRQRESFVFETVFSDPAGEKIGFLKSAVETGYNVIVCFIGLAGSLISEERVAMRVLQGGHDVPSEKLAARFPRTLANLQSALRQLPRVWIFDNTDLRMPYRLVAMVENARVLKLRRPVPKWLAPLLKTL